MKATEGPYQAEPEEATEGRGIAICAPKTGAVIAVIDPEDKADGEDWANARLLAASWDLRAKLKSFIADIDAMRLPLQIDEFAGAEFDLFAFFGSFTEYYDDSKNTMVESDAGVRVYWPNLAILLDEARELVWKLEGEAQHA
jgi:hypothetical protein